MQTNLEDASTCHAVLMLCTNMQVLVSAWNTIKKFDEPAVYNKVAFCIIRLPVKAFQHATPAMIQTLEEVLNKATDYQMKSTQALIALSYQTESLGSRLVLARLRSVGDPSTWV